LEPINNAAITDDDGAFFVFAVTTILDCAARILPTLEPGLKLMRTTPRLRRLTRKMSEFLHQKTMRVQRYYGEDLSQAMWCASLLALAKVDGGSLDWVELLRELQACQWDGLLPQDEKTAFEELQVTMNDWQRRHHNGD
jgi:hypothetical protein